MVREEKTTDKFGRMPTVQAEERSGKSKGRGDYYKGYRKRTRGHSSEI